MRRSFDWIERLTWNGPGIGVRTTNVLYSWVRDERRRDPLRSLDDLAAMTANDLLKRKGAGRKTLAEIEAALAYYGLSLRSTSGYESNRERLVSLSSEFGWP